MLTVIDPNGTNPERENYRRQKKVNTTQILIHHYNSRYSFSHSLCTLFFHLPLPAPSPPLFLHLSTIFLPSPPLNIFSSSLPSPLPPPHPSSLSSFPSPLVPLPSSPPPPPKKVICYLPDIRKATKTFFPVSG